MDKLEFYFHVNGVRSALTVSETRWMIHNNLVNSNYPYRVANEKYLVESGWTRIWWKLSRKSNNVKTFLFARWERHFCMTENEYLYRSMRALNGRSMYKYNLPDRFHTGTTRAQYGETLGFIISLARRSSVIARNCKRSECANRRGVRINRWVLQPNLNGMSVINFGHWGFVRWAQLFLVFVQIEINIAIINNRGQVVLRILENM